MDSDTTIIQSSLLPLYVCVQMEDGSLKERTFIHSFRIGRSPECEFQLQDNFVSRRHAEIYFEAGQWWVKDLSSTNGTYLNGVRVDRALLPPESRLEVGALTKDPHVIFWLGVQEKPNIPQSNTIDLASSQDTSTVQLQTAALTFPLMIHYKDDKGILRKKEYVTSFTVGRSQESDVRFNIPSVSNTHVRFVFEKDHWEALDAHSANGTYREGKKISQIALYKKTELEIGLGGPVIGVEPPLTGPTFKIEGKGVILNSHPPEKSQVVPSPPSLNAIELRQEIETYSDSSTGPQFIRPPKRWDESFGPNMEQTDVDRILQVSPFKDIDPHAFPSTTPLRGILLHDTRIIRFQPGDVVIRQGEFGNSAFFVLSGSVRLLLENLPNWGKTEETHHQKGIFETLSQLWNSSNFPEARDLSYLSKKSQTSNRNRQGSTAQIFLQDFSSILDKYKTTRLAAGEFFGESSALGRTPRSGTIICDQQAEILEIRWQGLRDLRSRSSSLKDHIDTIYRERNLEHHFRATPIFHHLNDLQLKQVAEQTKFETYGKFDWQTKFKNLANKDSSDRLEDEPIIANEGEYPNGLILIRSGFARLSQRLGQGHRTLSFLQRGQTFGFEELLHNYRSTEQIPLQFSLRAIGYVDLLFIPTLIVEEIILPTIPAKVLPLPHDPALVSPESLFSKKEDAARLNIDPEMIEFLVGERFINGTATMLINLDRCTRCDDCVRACAATHNNNPRFIRHGKQFGPYMVANACMHCADPVCMIGCPTGAINRNAFHGNIIINDAICIGCATCAMSCPYDNIRMVDIRDKNGNVFLDQDSHQPIMKATKCDLCSDELSGPACQRACPHNALTRLGLQDLKPLAKWILQ